MSQEPSSLVDDFINACIVCPANAKELAQAYPMVLHDECSMGDPALHWLTTEDYQEGLRVALSLGASLHTANRIGATALALAGSLRRFGCARLLLDHGADPNSDDGALDNPLHAAISGGAEEVVSLLLDRGANPWYVTGTLETVFSAMKYLRARDRMGMVELLLKREVTRPVVFEKAGFDRIFDSEEEAFGW